MTRRISWLVVATTSAVVVSFVIPLCLLVRTLAEDRAMAAADQQTRNVAILLATVPDDDRLGSLLDGLVSTQETTTSVLTASGTQLGGGSDMTQDPDVARALAGEAFRATDTDGGVVLLPVVVGDGTAVIRTTVESEELRNGVARAWAGIVALGVALMLASVVIARRLGRRVSQPVRDVAAVAHRLRDGDLSARASVHGTEETQELARALNGLAERTTELLAAERAVVGDLSHRLRTPVTALRLDAETVPDPALQSRLQGHIAVLQRTIDAIVREARRPVRTDLSARCDAAEVVARRLAFWAPLADDQGRSWRAEVPGGPLPVALAEDDLADLVDVLVDNVFAHTPEGTAVELGLTVVGEEAVLTVADHGPGFPSDAPGPEGRVERPGSTGLGLDIAARTASGAGGALVRAAGPTGGALVEVRLPLLPE